MEPKAAALVAGGGFAGAVTRHAVAVVLPGAFPVGTLVVNVVGAFLLGTVVYAADEGIPVSEAGRLFVSTGFLSSFTTYSTFASDTAALAPGVAALNVGANYVLGATAVLFAREVVRWRS